MTKRVHDEIMAGVQEAIAYTQGRRSGAEVHKVRVRHVDVKKARATLNLSQSEFAETFGVSVKTVQNWEQGERSPRGAALVLLNVIERNPKAVQEAIRV